MAKKDDPFQNLPRRQFYAPLSIDDIDVAAFGDPVIQVGDLVKLPGEIEPRVVAWTNKSRPKTDRKAYLRDYMRRYRARKKEGK